MAKSKSVSVHGAISQLIYSPRGGIEGVLLQIEQEQVHVVLDKDDAATAARIAVMGCGAALTVRARLAPPSDKGPSVHARYELMELDTPMQKKSGAKVSAAVFSGNVVRFNYARHGEANGVILDTGDFIHTRPGGMRALGLRIGDAVRAEGDAWPLLYGAGSVVEAIRVNGVTVEKSKVGKVAKKAAKKSVVKKAVKKAAKKVVKKIVKDSGPSVPGAGVKTSATVAKKVAPRIAAKKPLR